ncbi:hypothetical protein M9991_12400 [Chryseobacterium gallinarum]|uniref:hypothetical protein n=1 Tax=Chryseobacterium gallinarum TaxID=1324352 RepID=UPI002023CBAB|nr:hypothetical protein [Chryseobacterium gallinarum]MCL8537665.1 hypothetical protein [Chryseobacterium gallinarum]
MIKFITNNPSCSHSSLIQKFLTDAEEVYVSVAFLKMSGIKQLEPYFKKKTAFHILAGANFGITSPDALSLLLEHSNKANIKGYLNSLHSKIVFHPKMYLARSGKTGHILIGSANLTGGGLQDNHECSLYHRCMITDQIWLDAIAHFKQSILPQNADLLNNRVLAIYRDYHKQQKKVNDQSKKFANVDNNLIYDLKMLKRYFDRIDKKNMLVELKDKRNFYLQAREVLDQIISKPHTQREFRELLENLVGKKGMRGLWYSNGMFRGKESIFRQQSAFRKLVSNIKSNLDKSPEYIYDEARAISKTIHQVGPNFIGEIMMTYAPEKLANINANPITVLKQEGKVDIKSHSQLYNGKDYAEYNSIVKEIGFKLGLTDMLAVDYFFNEIYQKIK